MSGHEVYHSESRSSRLSFSAGELKMRESDSSSGYAIRALEGGRLGFSYCQAEGAIAEAIEKAKRISRFSVKSGFSFVGKSSFRSPDILDESLDPGDIDSLVRLVDEAKEHAASKGAKPRVNASMERSDVSIENTEGFSGRYSSSSFSLYVEAMHGDGYGFSQKTCFSRPASVAGEGIKAAEMALAMRGASKPDSGSYTAVMEPEALESLIDSLLPSFSGDWKRRKMTKIKEGEKLFSESLSICEDGLAGGMNARPFDDEGTPSERRALVEKGVAKSFLFDRETAALANVEGSGACSRNSYDSPPSIGASNIVISPGTWESLDELGNYLEIRSAHGSHTANLTTGDIGLEVSSAFLVEKGRRKPVRGFMLSGNIFEMFANIAGIEKKQVTYGSLISPRIAFGGLRAVS